MAKFNITVELDWIDEEYNLDEEIREAIVDKVVNKVQDKLIQQVDTECSNAQHLKRCFTKKNRLIMNTI